MKSGRSLRLYVQDLISVSLLSALLLPSSAIAKDVLLNGRDISSARNQEMKNVNIRIDDKGNIFIDAPHYKVHEEDTYSPLGHFMRDNAKENAGAPPTHQAPQGINNAPVGKTGAMVTPPNKDMIPASPEVPDFVPETSDAVTASAAGDKQGTKAPGSKRIAAKALPPADANGGETGGSVSNAIDRDSAAERIPVEKAGQRIPPGAIQGNGPMPSDSEENSGGQ